MESASASGGCCGDSEGDVSWRRGEEREEGVSGGERDGMGRRSVAWSGLFLHCLIRVRPAFVNQASHGRNAAAFK